MISLYMIHLVHSSTRTRHPWKRQWRRRVLHEEWERKYEVLEFPYFSTCLTHVNINNCNLTGSRHEQPSVSFICSAEQTLMFPFPFFSPCPIYLSFCVSLTSYSSVSAASCFPSNLFSCLLSLGLLFLSPDSQLLLDHPGYMLLCNAQCPINLTTSRCVIII